MGPTPNRSGDNGSKEQSSRGCVNIGVYLCSHSLVLLLLDPSCNHSDDTYSCLFSHLATVLCPLVFFLSHGLRFSCDFLSLVIRPSPPLIDVCLALLQRSTRAPLILSRPEYQEGPCNWVFKKRVTSESSFLLLTLSY